MILNNLLKTGVNEIRALEIIKEALNSSNPFYVLHYYGLKEFKYSDDSKENITKIKSILQNICNQ